MEGWIKLSRSIVECSFYNEKPFNRFQAWVDLLLRANYKTKKVFFGNTIITCERGQMITSMHNLAEAWGWSRKRVASFLALLQNDQMIAYTTDTKKTTITILNYDLYQRNDGDTEDDKGQNRAKKGTTEEPGLDLENTSLFDDAGTTQEPPKNHQGTTKEPPKNHQRTTEEPPKNHQGAAEEHNIRKKEIKKERKDPTPSSVGQPPNQQPTNKDLIAELTGEYRKLISENQYRHGDYSFIGRLYNEYGYDVVLNAINEMGYRLINFHPDQPLIFLRSLILKSKERSTAKVIEIPRKRKEERDLADAFDEYLRSKHAAKC